ncbi:MAG: UvrB/UvrC motif-containing protein [Puniceicoccales bacterium]|jgi:excinuclease ABC subunit B|nr:UvrB/UvrC motif-containing protein [Puniceicoccales bacterium]
MLAELENEMLAAADKLEFERAALLRDQIAILKGEKPVHSGSGANYRKRRGKHR